jgi:hypothetical protein
LSVNLARLTDKVLVAKEPERRSGLGLEREHGSGTLAQMITGIPYSAKYGSCASDVFSMKPR